MSKIRKILMIEDNPGDQLLTKMTLESSGLDITISFASDGQEGLEVLEALQKTGEMPDLILLDINMPRMDGHEFLEEYSQYYESIPPVIAMLTSSEAGRDKDKVAKYSCVKDYLVKPLDAEKLKNIDSYLP